MEKYNSDPVVNACAYTLVHAPGFVRYGSKPMRELAEGNSALLAKIENHLRSFEDAVAYPPNQVFIGNLAPDHLLDIEPPWYAHPLEGACRFGAFGEIMPEAETCP